MNRQLKTESNKSNHESVRGQESETDIVSFWLLLLFIATFFGIAAEETRRPSMFQTTSVTAAVNPLSGQPVAYSLDGTPLPQGASDARAAAARRFDLSSVDRDGGQGSIGSKLTGEHETPATGK